MIVANSDVGVWSGHGVSRGDDASYRSGALRIGFIVEIIVVDIEIFGTTDKHQSIVALSEDFIVVEVDVADGTGEVGTRHAVEGEGEDVLTSGGVADVEAVASDIDLVNEPASAAILCDAKDFVMGGFIKYIVVKFGV